tara:strand:- start:118 stop:522 length:405 start_codon:yes stop_codon:yes gene_type:complete
MSEYNSYFKIKIGTERNFGLVFAVFFMLISVYSFWYEKNFHLWTIILSCIFAFFALIFPKALSLPNRIWFRFGLLIGSIVSPITMAIIFFFTITPTGILMRIFGKDILNQKNNKKLQSGWIKKAKTKSLMKNQF